MTEHVSQDALERFVTGHLAFAKMAAFERHVSECEACAQQLSREAQLQLTLEDMLPPRAVRVAAISRHDELRRSGAFAGALLALAAGVLFFIRPASLSHGHGARGLVGTGSTGSLSAPIVPTVDAGVEELGEPMIASVDGGRFGTRRGPGWIASPSN